MQNSKEEFLTQCDEFAKDLVQWLRAYNERQRVKKRLLVDTESESEYSSVSDDDTESSSSEESQEIPDWKKLGYKCYNDYLDVICRPKNSKMQQAWGSTILKVTWVEEEDLQIFDDKGNFISYEETQRRKEERMLLEKKQEQSGARSMFFDMEQIRSGAKILYETGKMITNDLLTKQ